MISEYVAARQAAGDNRQVVALNNPAGEWHSVRALESGSGIMEMKEGRCSIDNIFCGLFSGEIGIT